MSLSRFYKTNTAFQKKAVLRDSSPSAGEPVWESIVQEEETPATATQVVHPDIVPETMPPVPEDQEMEAEPVDTPPTPDYEAAVITDRPSPDFPQAEPTIDVDIIRENAFTAGVAAGRQQAEEDFEDSTQTLIQICTELDRLRETILQNSAGEMKELVLAISEKIIRHSVTEQEETIVATIKDAIHLAVKSDAFQIQINPDDFKAVEARKKEIIDSISGLDNIVLKPDATVERGGCKLESTCCTVDATIASQIKVIQDSVLAEDTLHDHDQQS